MAFTYPCRITKAKIGYRWDTYKQAMNVITGADFGAPVRIASGHALTRKGARKQAAAARWDHANHLWEIGDIEAELRGWHVKKAA